MKEKELFVILTVPHAKCSIPIDHNCDLIAVESAMDLSKSLNRHKIKNKIFIGDINRRIIDLNREESRETLYHKELDDFIELNQSIYQLIILDIHSGRFNKEYSLVILKLKGFGSLDLLNAIQNETIGVVIIGSNENYIVYKGLKRKIPSLLLEFNENYEYNSSFFDKITESILKWRDLLS